jgi:hypothetical protein
MPTFVGMTSGRGRWINFKGAWYNIAAARCYALEIWRTVRLDGNRVTPLRYPSHRSAVSSRATSA